MLCAALVVWLAAAATPVAPSDAFAPLLEEGVEWVYTPYAEDPSGHRTPLELPGEVRLRVALVRIVGATKVVALVPYIDGVDAARLVDDMDLVSPFPVAPVVLSVSSGGIRGLALSLDEARVVTEQALAASARGLTNALVFPGKPTPGWRHHWSFDDEQQSYEADGRLSTAHERVAGTEVEVWRVTWKGRACFAGTCVPYAAINAYSPALGLVRVCRLDIYAQPPMHCLGMVDRARGARERRQGAAPTLGDVWRALQVVRPALESCLAGDTDMSVLAFRVEPDGSLSHVRERNLSEGARCTTAAVAGVRLPPFEGPAVVVEHVSFAKGGR